VITSVAPQWPPACGDQRTSASH